MDNDDFSFCPTGVVQEEERVEAQKLDENIGGMKFENKIENGVDFRHNDSIPKNKNSGNDDDTKQKKQGGTVGSLSFTVTDMSSAPVRKPNPSTSVVVKKGAAPRNKVPFEKGYSQMDWMKLSRTHPDLAGLNGQSNKRLITLNEVKQHQSEGSMWTVLKGRVYNITPYMKFHPGGVDMLMKGVGKDCTALFNKYHAWVNADILLEKCLVGIFDDSKK